MKRTPFPALARLLPLSVALAACTPLASWAQSTPDRAPPAAQMDLARTTLVLDGKKLGVQIARSERELAIGLMSRISMPADEGMVFIFPQAATQCFWMRNTLIPLSVAFIDAQGRIINLADMQPLSDDAHCSLKPAQFVLEANQGWFKKNGIKAGIKIEGIKAAETPSKSAPAAPAQTAPRPASS